MVDFSPQWQRTLLNSSAAILFSPDHRNNTDSDSAVAIAPAKSTATMLTIIYLGQMGLDYERHATKGFRTALIDMLETHADAFGKNITGIFYGLSLLRVRWHRDLPVSTQQQLLRTFSRLVLLVFSCYFSFSLTQSGC